MLFIELIFSKLPDTIGKGKLNQIWEKLTDMIEEDIESGKSSMGVSTEFMDLLMTHVLTKPRNIVGFPKNRDIVGGFIFGVFALAGLMVRTEPFKFSPISPEDIQKKTKTV